MPDPATTSLVADQAKSAGLDFLGNALNSGLEIIGNEYLARQAQKRNMEFYRIQRQDNLADRDNEREYASPEEHMKRLKTAGLSPHLAYSNNAANISTKGASLGNSQATRVNMQSAPISSSLITSLQAENLRMQNLKIQAETANVNADTQAKTLNYSVDSETLLPRKKAELEKLATEIANGNMNTAERAQNIETMKAQAAAMAQETILKEIESRYREQILLGNVASQKLQNEKMSQETRQIMAQIRAINTNTDLAVRKFPHEVQQIIANTLYTRNQLKWNDQQQESQLRERQMRTSLDEEELNYLRTVSPEKRFWIEKALQSGLPLQAAKLMLRK